VGPAPGQGGVIDLLMELAQGHSSALGQQVKRQAPDSPTDLPKHSWGAVLKGTLKSGPWPPSLAP
jgi:hypothetical protein